jgi:mono/diheme cytochrome c family protein
MRRSLFSQAVHAGALMRRSIIPSVIAGAAVAAVFASGFSTLAFAADKPANVARGKQLYLATGCYQCHGTSGEGGGNAGPRLAPGPMPYEGLLMQLRKPRARMPVYTAVVMPDSDVAAIYAYLQSVPKGKTASEIPMLKALSN